MKKPFALITLDGWGFSPGSEGNAITLANTPYYDEICDKFPRILLHASGLRVGLPQDVAGNSEIGHLNLGAGRVIESDLTRINNAISAGNFEQNEVLQNTLKELKETGKSLHLIGLIAGGEAHSSQNHLFSILRAAKKSGLTNVFIHCILDGQDTPSSSADIYLEALEIKLADIGIGRIATICGRFYAMDRNQNWERTARAYTMLIHGEGERAEDAVWSVRNSYLRGVTDKFVEPIVLEKNGEPIARIQEGDTAFFFNFRADRIRQLVKSVGFTDFAKAPTGEKPHVKTVCLTSYDELFGLPVIFPSVIPRKTLGEVFAEQGLKNLRIAESENELSVTRTFNGGFEREFEGESRFIIASPKVAGYELEPEMSVFKTTDKLMRAIDEAENDVFIVNIPLPSAVGQSGRLDKTIEAIQYIDTCLGWISRTVRKADGTAIIVGTHCKAEQMFDLNNKEPFLSNTTNQVPFHLVDKTSSTIKLREDGALEDVAPTILGILGIEKPEEMTGRDLRAD